ncbi:GIY-YIG nuclease family protein [Pseudanabaena sp. Chao 1811]|uniref:GIY-YIG nuclease family protein n=1 Tax=Pseudanabaena sp. Chao 1811 TaxID=2963092 RepID=UPI0022F3E89E|nr:GIY-YIG nuclease family protein [Pseudanabaena sp. Chao 1811]
MPKYTTDDDLALLEELGLEITTDQTDQLSAREERIIAGFEEIQRFVEEQGRMPQHGSDRDIFERLYAVRLDRLRESSECREVLKGLDAGGLLDANNINQSSESDIAEITDAELLAALGAETDPAQDITHLTHVRSRQEIKTAEEIAQRNQCADFAEFKPIFDQVQQDLKSGQRQTIKYQDNAAINQGDLFILDGQKVIVAEMGKWFTSDYGLPNSRLRVVYDNGTESDLLLRSLQRALNKDKTSRRITTPDLGPLFSDTPAKDDLVTGYIYVLRSKSDDPFIVANHSIIHKIGVTSGDVKKRVANAPKDPTYLLADVEIITTFKLANINPKKLEALLHKFFDHVRLDVQLQDRFGIPVKPREWFLVPLEVVESVITKIKEGNLDQFRYDPETANLVRTDVT